MKKPITSQSYFKTLNIIYFSQAVTPLAFSLVVIYLLQSHKPIIENTAFWYYLVPMVLLGCIGMGYYIFNAIMKRIPSTLSLKEKMPKYSSAILIRSSLLEAPALLGAIAAYITGEVYHLATPFIVVLVSILLRPTKNSITLDLNLSPQERAKLDNSNAIISEANQSK
jgi:hypothetical protein